MPTSPSSMAIAHMARGLKLEMVAEGVEEEYQLRYLRSLNCPVIQGFIYSEAVPSCEARELLSETGLMKIREHIKAKASGDDPKLNILSVSNG